MPSTELDNLVRTGQLKQERPSQAEYDGLFKSGKARLADARKKTLALESRFDLAYGAVHALALAALRWHGYRSENRYIVFQALPHTLGIAIPLVRTLAKAHTVRNAAEYEGHLEADQQLVEDLVGAAETVLKAVEALGPVRASGEPRVGGHRARHGHDIGHEVTEGEGGVVECPRALPDAALGVPQGRHAPRGKLVRSWA